MKIFLSKNLVLLLATLVIALLFPFTTFAATAADVGLTVAPSIINADIGAGESQKRDITVVNNGLSPVAMNVYVENFAASDIYGGVSFNTDTSPTYSALTWVKLSEKKLVLGSGQSQKIDYTIKVPENAEAGGHYAVIFFEPVHGVEQSAGSSVGVSQRVGALLFITVDGDITEAGQVLGASTTDKCSGVQCSFKTAPFREWGPVPFVFQYENAGNVHVRVSGKIQIFNTFGKQVGEVPVAEKTVLPGTTRQFEANWLREPLLGKYTARLTLTYGASNSEVRAITTFWAFPWKLALLVLGAITTGIALYTIVVRLRKKKRNKST